MEPGDANDRPQESHRQNSGGTIGNPSKNARARGSQKFHRDSCFRGFSDQKTFRIEPAHGAPIGSCASQTHPAEANPEFSHRTLFQYQAPSANTLCRSLPTDFIGYFFKTRYPGISLENGNDHSLPLPADFVSNPAYGDFRESSKNDPTTCKTFTDEKPFKRLRSHRKNLPSR